MRIVIWRLTVLHADELTKEHVFLSVLVPVRNTVKQRLYGHTCI